MGNGWIGVDFDGTLARDDEQRWPGSPVPRMVGIVKQMLAEGEDVRIFTARAAIEDLHDRAFAVAKILEWCQEHLGQELPVTAIKDMDLVEFYDDRAVSVQRNTGVIL